MPRADPVIEATDRWFLRRGLPHFIAEYDAAHDIWTRALPALLLLFLAEVAGNAINADYSFWFDLVAVAGAFALLLALWAVGNLARGRRPFSRVTAVGPFEIGFFVLVPALVPIVFGRQLGSAVATSVFNVVVLAVVYVTTSYAVVPVIRWGLGRLLRQLNAIVSLLARALPLIALLVTFLFLTAEVWQTAGVLVGPAYWVAVGLFPVVATVFLASRVPKDVGELNHFEHWSDIAVLVDGTPIAADSQGDDTDLELVPPLGNREWGNVGLVAVFSQGLQVLMVSALIGSFFVLLGALLVDVTTTNQWVQPLEANVLATLTLGGRELVVTEELLRVAGFLTAFTSLNFTVYLLTDETYRREFRNEVVAELRQAFAVRAAYRVDLAKRADQAAGPSATMSST